MCREDMTAPATSPRPQRDCTYFGTDLLVRFCRASSSGRAVWNPNTVEQLRNKQNCTNCRQLVLFIAQRRANSDATNYVARKQ
jgi:hypothetical protein